MARYEMKNPIHGRVAIWTTRSRGRHNILHEGTPWTARSLGSVEAGGPGEWRATHHDGQRTLHRTREIALREVSRRVFEELDLEVRTSSRVVFLRPGGIVDRHPEADEETASEAPAPRM